MSDSLWFHGLQHVRLPCPSLSFAVGSTSRPLNWRCHLSVSSSVTPSLPALNLSQHQDLFMSWLFISGGQSIEASTSASVLPMNIQGLFPLGLTDLVSLQSKGLSRVFSSTTVQKHQFFGAQPSLWSNSHIHTWLLEKTIALTRWTFVGKVISLLLNMFHYLHYLHHSLGSSQTTGREHSPSINRKLD